MPDEPAGRRQPPLRNLRPASASAKWSAPAAAFGALLLVGAVVLAFVAPSPLWFLLYPLLVVGAVGALATAAAWLLRHF
jgi:hypothetical protein